MVPGSPTDAHSSIFLSADKVSQLPDATLPETTLGFHSGVHRQKLASLDTKSRPPEIKQGQSWSNQQWVGCPVTKFQHGPSLTAGLLRGKEHKSVTSALKGSLQTLHRNVTLLPEHHLALRPGRILAWKITAGDVEAYRFTGPSSHQPAAPLPLLSKPQVGCCPGPFSHPHTHLTTVTRAFRALR